MGVLTLCVGTPSAAARVAAPPWLQHPPSAHHQAAQPPSPPPADPLSRPPSPRPAALSLEVCRSAAEREVPTALMVLAHMAITQPHMTAMPHKTLKVRVAAGLLAAWRVLLGGAGCCPRDFCCCCAAVGRARDHRRCACGCSCMRHQLSFGVACCTTADGAFECSHTVAAHGQPAGSTAAAGLVAVRGREGTCAGGSGHVVWSSAFNARARNRRPHHMVTAHGHLPD